MNLTLFFRLLLVGVFQNKLLEYNEAHFYCPWIAAKDGFIVSLQIGAFNYCASENGYRTLGHTMQEVEFGFPSENEELLKPYTEDSGDITQSVGRVPISILEEIFEKHGGIDWEKTISPEIFNGLLNIK